MKEKKVKIEYKVSGKGKFENTEIGGIKEGEEIHIGNDSKEIIKIEEIKDDYCIVIIECGLFKVLPDNGEYINNINKESGEIKRLYKTTVKVNEEISLEPPVSHLKSCVIKITSIYEEEKMMLE